MIGGVPNILYKLCEKYNARDCKKSVNPEHIDILKSEYAEEPVLFNPAIREFVLSVHPEFKTPCTSRTAVETFIKIIRKVDVIEANIANVRCVV